MKIVSLSIRTPATMRPITNLANGPAYKAWQVRWQDHRHRDWEWDTSPAQMGVEAIAALVQDLEDMDGPAAPTTAIRLLTALSMGLPPDERSFAWTIPLQVGPEDPPVAVSLSLALRPTTPEQGDAANVGLTLVSENAQDSARLETLGVLNADRIIPSADAMAFIEEAAQEGTDRPVGSVGRWDPDAVKVALVDAQKRWPRLGSPIQALAVAVGLLLWRHGVAMRATETELILREVTFGRGEDQAPLDVFLRVTQEKIASTSVPVTTRRPAHR